MTREEMRIIREQKKAAKDQARQDRKNETQERNAWNKMVERAKVKGAWIEDAPDTFTLKDGTTVQGTLFEK